MAERIVAFRRANGAFLRIEDIQNVRGIGPQTFEDLAPHLTVDPASTTYSAPGGLIDPPLPTRETNHPTEAGSVGDSTVETVPLLVNINTATAAELEELNGIGPVLAERIIEYRESAGGFRSVEELIEVRGIGPRTLERLAPFVTIASDDD
ncbi:MAG: helix-hairpin-helix domain-containing protein [Rhodothermaceae bacterium]|nr:helix-hairpin-helix domain-containing protein [Rhodothermaceae bacterium]